MRIGIIDIESNGLPEDMIDYSSFPYKLKPTAKLWCVVIRDLHTDTYVSAVQEEITKEWMRTSLEPFDVIIAHNGVKFDLPMLKLFGVLDYTIAYLDQTDTVFDRACRFVDTLILSRIVNPDRFGGHSLDAWGERTGNHKTDFRKARIEEGSLDTLSPKGAEFLTYTPLMLDYCIQDTSSNASTYKCLAQELKGYDGWKSSIKQEHKLADLAFRRENLGFSFDKELALSLLEDLGEKLETLANTVNPLLPERKLTIGEIKNFTPPKTQTTKDGELSAAMLRFVERIGGKMFDGDSMLAFENDVYTLPIDGALKTKTQATIDNLDAVKMHLISLGWNPSEWKERDLTKDSKKQTIPLEKRIKALDKWYAETIEGKYKEQRLEILNMDEAIVYNTLKKKLSNNKPVRVPTSPAVRVGVEKDLCPSLVSLGDKVSFAKDFADYLTYKHRKSTIAGGDIEEMDLDNESPNTGFLARYREVDGRIPTPAIEIGASTNRYKHIGVANIPRASSVYGKEMRSLFGAGKGFLQLGFDFASLEARIEGHYVFNGTDGSIYAESLIAEKPNDVHCFSGDTEILTKQGWKKFNEITFDTEVAQYNEDLGCSEWVKPTDIVWEKYVGSMFHYKNKNTDQLLTPNHRMYIVSDKSLSGKIILAKDFYKKAANSSDRFLNGALIENPHYISSSFLKLLIATQADGHLSRDSSSIVFTFTREDKCERLELLLDQLDARYTKSNHTRKNRTEFVYRLNASNLTRNLRYWLDKNKALKSNILTLGHEQRCMIVDELALWDGTKTNSGVVLDITCEKTISTLQAVCSSLSIKSTVTKFNKKTTFGTCQVYRLFISTNVNCWSGTLTLQKKKIKYDGFVGCVSVPSGLVVVRRNGKVFISGNSVNAKMLDISRPDAKSFKYALTYGAQIAKIMKMFACSRERAEELFNGFWEGIPSLKELKSEVEQEWLASGRKYIAGIDGRRINIRSQHSIINALFQSAGVICAKYTTVFLMQELEEQGFCIDPFEGKPECCSMIEYHDENQLLIQPKTADFAIFDTEDEAKAFADIWEGDQLSAISEGKGGKFYICLPNPVSIAIGNSIKKVCKIFNLNVPLGFEWIVNKDWYGCH